MSISKWDFDLSHSSINFHIRHLMVSKVHGRFSKWGGVLELDESDLTKSRLEVTIDPSSIDTKEEKRDAHLRSPDFLDVENHPTIEFRSTHVEVIDDERLRVSGDLTIRGVTRSVTLDATFDGEFADPWGNQRLGFSASTEIDREDWGLTWNVALETGGVLVARKARLELTVSAVRR